MLKTSAGSWYLVPEYLTEPPNHFVCICSNFISVKTSIKIAEYSSNLLWGVPLGELYPPDEVHIFSEDTVL
jgi:hypothetical protein